MPELAAAHGESLRARISPLDLPPATVQAVFEEQIEDAAEIEQTLATLRAMEGPVRKIVERLDARTRCIVIALFKLSVINANEDLGLEFGPDLAYDFCDTDGEEFVRAHAEAFAGDRDMQTLLTVIQAADRVAEETQ